MALCFYIKIELVIKQVFFPVLLWGGGKMRFYFHWSVLAHVTRKETKLYKAPSFVVAEFCGLCLSKLNYTVVLLCEQG